MSFLQFKDTTGHGDGDRILPCWKFLFLFFRASGHTNYALEALTWVITIICSPLGMLNKCDWPNSEGIRNKIILHTRSTAQNCDQHNSFWHGCWLHQCPSNCPLGCYLRCGIVCARAVELGGMVRLLVLQFSTKHLILILGESGRIW